MKQFLFNLSRVLAHSQLLESKARNSRDGIINEITDSIVNVANTAPIFTLTPNVGSPIMITTTYAQTKSDGTSAGSGADFMVKAFTSGANGSFLDRIRFFSVASAAATTGVATVLRAYLSTVASPGATTNANTFLIGEVSVPAISSSNSTNATNYYDIVLGIAIPTGYYVHVSQHVAQTTNQAWMAIAFGGDY